MKILLAILKNRIRCSNCIVKYLEKDCKYANVRSSGKLMKNIILWKTASHAIIRHKTRSFLTILGIMIGVAAIIVTFSIGRGAEERIKAQIAAIGEGAIYSYSR